MRKSTSLWFIVPLFAIVLASCSKEGPTGPQGDAGPPGPQGPVGSANVIYSSWVATTSANWVGSYGPPYWALYNYDRAATGITQAIMDNGIVLCYMKNWSYLDDVTMQALKSPAIAQLPFTADPDLLDFYDYVIPAAGTIKFLYKSNYQTWTEVELAGTSFRYVIIPGSVSGGRGINGTVTYEGYTGEELKAMPYEEISKLFHIPAEGSNIR